MAIGDNYNIREATTSQAYAYKCWYNYNYGNNTMGISSSDMGKIITTWKSNIPDWKTTAENDDNSYEIDDISYKSSKDAGKKMAQDRTGYDGNKGGMIARGVGDAVSGVGAAVGQMVSKKIGEKVAQMAGEKAASKAIEEIGGEIGGEIGEEIGEEAAAEASKKTAEKAGKISFIIGCTLGLASGIAYKTKKPNKEQKEACDELQNVMNDSQASLNQAQSDMADADDKHVELAEEAQATTEDGNDEITENKTELDLYRAQYDAIMEKANSGQQLTENEKNFIKEVVPLMQELGTNINTLADDMHSDVSDIYDEMNANAEETFNIASETMGEVEGVTDYAESFDEATRTMCYVEGAAQTLNAAGSATAAAKAGKFALSGGWFTAWAWAFAGMGATGALFSGAGVKEQFGWAGDVGDEIHLRRDTQDLNATTSEVFDERVDDFDGYLAGIEDLAIETPKDLDTKIPTEAPTIPTTPQNGNTSTNGAGTTNNSQQSGDKNDKDKKDKQDKQV